MARLFASAPPAAPVHVCAHRGKGARAQSAILQETHSGNVAIGNTPPEPPPPPPECF